MDSLLIVLLQILPHEVSFLTRKGLKYILKQKINRVNLRQLTVRPLSGQDSLDTVMEVVNKAYIIEIGNTGLAFKEQDRLRSVEDLVKEETHVAQLGGEIVGVVGFEVKEDKVFIGEN